MHFCFILNPVAGAGTCKALFEKALSLISARGATFSVKESAHAGHAEQLAIEAAKEGATHVVAVGGDGTFREVASGLCKSSPTPAVTVGLLPFGTGNDLARALRIPSDPAQAAEILLAGNARKMDVGMVNNSYFFNATGVGFDVDVLINTERYKKHRGMLPYLLGIAATLFHLKKYKLTYEIGGTQTKQDSLLFVVANGTHFGGGMHVAPGADPFSGSFQICSVRSMHLPRLLTLLPLFIKGKHTNKKPVRYFAAEDEIILDTPEAYTVQLDGELVEKTPARIKLLRAHLPILVPKVSV